MNDPYVNNEFSLRNFLSDKDVLIRHKWPEEKPKGFTWVLIRRINIFGEPQNHVAWYTKDGEFYVSGFDDKVDDITHWWELPEV